MWAPGSPPENMAGDLRARGSIQAPSPDYTDVILVKTTTMPSNVLFARRTPHEKVMATTQTSDRSHVRDYVQASSISGVVLTV